MPLIDLNLRGKTVFLTSLSLPLIATRQHSNYVIALLLLSIIMGENRLLADNELSIIEFQFRRYKIGIDKVTLRSVKCENKFNFIKLI